MFVRNRQRKRYNTSRQEKFYAVGDLVLVYRPIRKKDRSKKLLHPFHGPFVIAKRLSAVNHRRVSKKPDVRESSPTRTLWACWVRCAVYVQNRTVSSTSNKSPYEHWYKRKPDISHLRVFGCRVFVHVPDEKRRKLDPKATEGMMMGYVEESTSCYKVGPKNLDKPMVLSNQLLISDLEPGIEKAYEQQRCHL